MSELHRIAREVTDEIMGPGTYARLNATHPDPAVRNEALRGSSIPTEEHRSMPRIELLIVRDPDAETEVIVFVDGEQVTPDAEEHVDPGAGHTRDEWDDYTNDVEEGMTFEYLTPAFREAVVEARNAWADNEYITD